MFLARNTHLLRAPKPRSKGERVELLLILRAKTCPAFFGKFLGDLTPAYTEATARRAQDTACLHRYLFLSGFRYPQSDISSASIPRRTRTNVPKYNSGTRDFASGCDLCDL